MPRPTHVSALPRPPVAQCCRDRCPPSTVVGRFSRLLRTGAHIPPPHDHVAVLPVGKITLRDLKRCKLANVFFDTFFNIEKYLDHEQKEQVSLLRVSVAGGSGCPLRPRRVTHVSRAGQ